MPFRIRIAVFALLVGLSSSGARALELGADENSPDHVIIVAAVDMPPFAMKEDDGTWSGISMDLWRQIADTLGLTWKLREIEMEEVSPLLRNGSVDVALGAIAISAEGGKSHDFSHPYLTAGLGFAERAKGTLSWGSAFGALLTPDFLRLIVLVVGAIVLMGVLITIVERRHNATQFGGPLSQGIANGVWWAAVTMTTVGYGDATPKTGTGRSLAVVWMLIGLVVVALLTATATSILTVGSLQGSVQRPTDLFSLRLGAIIAGPGDEYLTRHHVKFSAYEHPNDALAGLADGHTDAILGPIPVLRHVVSQRWQGRLRVSSIVIEPLPYAIGLTHDSPLRDRINNVLLDIIEEDGWQELEQQYLGAQ